MLTSRIPEGWPTRWVLACGFAELLGIAFAALWWVMVDRIYPAPSSPFSFAFVLVAKASSGLIEGAILGWAQGILLKAVFPGLSVKTWIVATCVVAVAGWTAGSLIPMLIEAQGLSHAATPPFDPPLGQTAAFAGIFGAFAGLLFGCAQWLVLRGVTERAAYWIIANAAGWALALPVIYVAASSGDPGAPLANALVHGLGSGLLAGLIVGLATLVGLFRIVRG